MEPQRPAALDGSCRDVKLNDRSEAYIATASP